jgi:hypothetical protein
MKIEKKRRKNILLYLKIFLFAPFFSAAALIRRKLSCCSLLLYKCVREGGDYFIYKRAYKLSLSRERDAHQANYNTIKLLSGSAHQ